MEILNWVDIPNHNFHIAEFTVYLPAYDLSLHKIKLCKSKKGGHFIGYPNFCGETDENGKKKWHPFIVFGEKRKKDFEGQVLDLIKPFLQPGSETTHEYRKFF